MTLEQKYKLPCAVAIMHRSRDYTRSGSPHNVLHLSSSIWIPLTFVSCKTKINCIVHMGFRYAGDLTICHLLLMLGTHAHKGYSSQFVCLSVCLSVCPHSSASLGRVCNELNLPAAAAWSLLHSEGFQLTAFAKKLSFPYFSFCIAKQSAILHLAVDVGAVLHARCNVHAQI